MGVVPVDEDTGAVISEIARKLRVSREEVVRMLVDGEIKNEMVGDGMNPDMEKKLSEMLGQAGDNKSMIDKMMEMKMLERLDSGGEKKGNDMAELMDIMKMKMMMEAMQTKKDNSIDPNMLMMLMLMKKDDGKTDMTKIVETITASTSVKDDAMKELLKELLDDKKETEKEQELMAVIDQQNQMIAEMKREQEEMRRMIMYGNREHDPRRKKDPDEDLIGSVQKIEKMKDALERIGMTKPPSAEDREIAIKQDVVKAKADLERETMQTSADITKKVLEGIDNKADKFLTIIEALLKQPPAQREQTLEDFQRRGAITPQEKQQIYQQMQQQIAMQQAPQPPAANEVDGIGMKARQMWEDGYDATTIARELHIPITQTYQYRPQGGE